MGDGELFSTGYIIDQEDANMLNLTLWKKR